MFVNSVMINWSHLKKHGDFFCDLSTLPGGNYQDFLLAKWKQKLYRHVVS